MSKLILKRFACVVETDEIGSDSPYFLTYVGEMASPNSTMKLTRQGNWHNEVDQGEKWVVNEEVSNGFDFVASNTVVLCGMVEEDEGIDINNQDADAIEAALNRELKEFKDTGSTTVTKKIRRDMITRMRGAISNMLSGAGASDDLVAVKALTLNGNLGEQSIVTLVGDGGRYRVRYGVA